MNEKKEIEPRNIAITEFNQEKLSIEQIINIRNRSQTLKPNNFKFTPHLYPKKNNINVSPIHNYFKSNEEKTNISLTQSLLLKRSPDSFSSPNSEELNENNNKELYDDSSFENDFELSYSSNENKNEIKEESKIKELKNEFKNKIKERKYSKEYENILILDKNKFSLNYEEKQKSIFKKHIEKEFLLDTNIYNDNPARHSYSNQNIPRILRILVSTCEEKKMYSTNKLLRMSSKI